MDIYEQITKMADEIAPELVAQRREFPQVRRKGLVRDEDLLHHCQKIDRDGV